MRTRVCAIALLWAALAVSAAGSDRNSDVRLQLGSPFNNLEVETRGQVQFTDDDRDVKSISPGGLVRLHQGWPQRRRTYEVRPGANGLARTYRVEGRDQALDSEGRSWVASGVLTLIRESGIGAPERVRRILARGGPTAVLAEVAQIWSDGSKRIYLTELIVKGHLTDPQARDALRAVKKIGSDGDKAALLADTAPVCLRANVRESWFTAVTSIGSDGDRHATLKRAIEVDRDPETLILASRAAGGIGSDGDKAAVLKEIARVYRPEARLALFRAAGTIGSDGDRKDVLATILRYAGSDREAMADVLRTAGSIGSDGDKASLLAEAARSDLSSEAVQHAFFDATNSIGSDGDRAMVLSTVLDRQKGTARFYPALAASAGGIGSDGDKASVLGRLGETMGGGGGAWEPFFTAVKSIGSDGDRAGVLKRLLKRRDLANATVVGAVESAAGIGSDGDKADVMVLAAHAYGGRPEVRTALEKALPSVHSDGDMGRVTHALLEIR